MQPALFTLEYALAQWWRSLGVEPSAVIGHSLGEYTAACIAGMLHLDDALRLVVARGTLMEEMPAGRMLAVRLPEAELTPLLSSGLDLAAVNGPNSCVVAGSPEEVVAFARTLGTRQIAHRYLDTDKAFHSAHVEDILPAFLKVTANIQLRAPLIPLLSNLTGDWIDPQQALDPVYWVKHMRATVRFANGVRRMSEDGEKWVALEVGPGNTLGGFIRQQRKVSVHMTRLRLRTNCTNESRTACETLAQFWLAGQRIDWEQYYTGEHRCRIPIPAYPFQRKRCWIDPKSSPVKAQGSTAATAAADNEEAPAR